MENCSLSLTGDGLQATWEGGATTFPLLLRCCACQGHGEEHPAAGCCHTVSLVPLQNLQRHLHSSRAEADGVGHDGVEPGVELDNAADHGGVAGPVHGEHGAGDGVDTATV